jgi:hypothetical protein
MTFGHGETVECTTMGYSTGIWKTSGPLTYLLLMTHYGITEFMVLVLQLDNVFREPILDVASQKVLPGEGFALMSPIIVSTRFSVLPGFAPAGEALLFRQKDPKPLTPRLASLERMDASLRRADQLAPLKHL